MAVMNNMHSGKERYDPAAFDKLKQAMLRIAQLVLRETTAEELSRLDTLDSMPVGI